MTENPGNFDSNNTAKNQIQFYAEDFDLPTEEFLNKYNAKSSCSKCYGRGFTGFELKKLPTRKFTEGPKYKRNDIVLCACVLKVVKEAQKRWELSGRPKKPIIQADSKAMPSLIHKPTIEDIAISQLTKNY
jgi:hypothetical protein